MIVRRARRELGTAIEEMDDDLIHGKLEQRLRRSREKINAAIVEFASVLTHVNYQEAEAVDLSWLKDEDDIPIVQTAIAAGVPGILVTDNQKDFPVGEESDGILILAGDMFLEYLYQIYPEANEVINRLAANRRRESREGRSTISS